MNPQDSTTGSLDPQAVALTKAIRQQESGGSNNPTLKGASGEYGAYQFLPGTWDAYSKEAGVNVPLQQATIQQQNEVAYNKIKQWKDQGYNPGQIASMWNAGEGEPNAYQGTFKDGSPSTGVNKEGVQYDVPAYAKKVAGYYQQFKGATPSIPPLEHAARIADPAPDSHASLLQTITNALETIFPGTKQIGEALGTAALNVGRLAEGKQPDIPVNVPKEIGGILSAGSMVGAPEIGGESALGRIAGTAGLGAVAGAGGGLASGGGVSGALQGAGTGALAGGALGGVSEIIGKAAQYLPYRLVRTFLPGTSPETAQYALDKGVGSPISMLNKSTRSLSKIGSGIEDVLNHPALKDVVATAPDVYSPILERYPNAGLSAEDMGTSLKKLVPLQQGLVDKLESDGLNAAELNQLKTALGKATYKTVYDEPAVKAGKDLGNAAYGAISQWMEQKVPDAAPLFSEYNKELQLNKALTQAIRRGDKARPFTLRDIVALMSGFATLGPLGALGALGAEKAATSPAINLRAAGLLSNLAPATGAASRQALVGLLGQGQTPMTK